jgi:PAS domain S-box-containing protein
VPIIRNGVVTYVLSAVVRPEIFNALLAPQRLPHDWVGVIVDGNKNIVARTVNSESTLGKPVSESLQAALTRASEGWFRGSTVEGTEVYTPYNRSPFSGWTVAIGIPAGEVETALHASLFTVVFLGLAFLASGIALAWFFSAPIARSIRGLSGMAENLGLGRRPPSAAAIAGEPSSIGRISVSEIEDVTNALLKADQLIQERSDERNKVEADLRLASERLELAQAAANVGSFERDLMTGDTVWSTSQEKLYGLAGGSFGGKAEHWLERVHPDDRGATETKLRDAIKNKSSLNVEFRVLRPDGEVRWIASQARVFVDIKGNPRRLLGVNIDITERRRVEEALKHFNEDLEKCVVQQTAKLMETNAELLRGMEQQRKLEEQLRQSQKMEAIGTLAGGIAHDFNNILGIILGYTHELLNASGGDRENSSQSLEVIASSAERGAKIVKQLLTFARKTGVEHKPVDVNALVRETLDILKEIFPKNLRFSSNLDPAIPMIEGDHNQLQQALINICLNARDAMPEGGTLSISSRRVPAPEVRDQFGETRGDYVCIDLGDTGGGMDVETRRRVFEPFFTTKKDGGTGLGLSVVYGIVQTHGGFIDLESENTGGTVVKIFLPIPSQAQLTLETQPDGRKEVFSVGQTILVVEDEPHMLDLIRLSAEKRGFRVFSAADGEQAVKLYEKRWQEIDAVVLDWGLPRLDGSAVYRKIKEINPRVTVIGVSGYLDFDLKERMLREGVRDFLQKPCTPNEILEKVLSSAQLDTAADS